MPAGIVALVEDLNAVADCDCFDSDDCYDYCDNCDCYGNPNAQWSMQDFDQKSGGHVSLMLY